MMADCDERHWSETAAPASVDVLRPPGLGWTVDICEFAAPYCSAPSQGNDRQVACIADALSPYAGLALHEALADELTSRSSASKLIVWRSTPALFVTLSETR